MERGELPDTGPRGRRDFLIRGDILAAVLGGFAIFFAAFSLFHGPPSEAGGAAFIWVAPLAASLILLAETAMFMDLIRHGIARILYAVSAAAFAAGGMIFLGEVAPGRVIVSYWLPALLSILGALALTRAHVQARHALEKATAKPKARSRRAPWK